MGFGVGQAADDARLPRNWLRLRRLKICITMIYMGVLVVALRVVSRVIFEGSNIYTRNMGCVPYRFSS
jgi:hypothetical protein